MHENSGTILVTGGAGYIGSHIVLALRDRGYRVAVIDDLSTGFRSHVPDDVPLHVGDIADRDLLDRIFASEPIRAVMHFAGSILVGESVLEPLKYYLNNTGKTRDLLAAVMEHGVRHFVFSSTAAVYGNPEETPVGEDAAKQPINPYGSSKLITEWMLADVAHAAVQKGQPFNYAALRYFNVAGADPAGRTGQSTAGATHLIKVACEVATGKRPQLLVFGDDYPTRDGTAIRDYIHVSDLADAHVLALEKLFCDPAKSFTCNCGYGAGFTVREVIEAVESRLGAPLSWEMSGRRAGDPAVLVADCGRIRSLLGWTPRYADIRQIIADAYAWERKLAERKSA